MMFCPPSTSPLTMLYANGCATELVDAHCGNATFSGDGPIAHHATSEYVKSWSQLFSYEMQKSGFASRHADRISRMHWSIPAGIARSGGSGRRGLKSSGWM